MPFRPSEEKGTISTNLEIGTLFVTAGDWIGTKELIVRIKGQDST